MKRSEADAIVMEWIGDRHLDRIFAGMVVRSEVEILPSYLPQSDDPAAIRAAVKRACQKVLR